jgi:periplasmic protein CpxP/Spy
MSKVKILVMAVVGLLLLNITVIGLQIFKKPPLPFKGNGTKGEGGPKNIIIERLRFDKDQVLAYEKIIETHRITAKVLKDSINNAKNNLYQSLKQDNVASNSDSLINQLSALQHRIEETHFYHFLQLKAICKAEQMEEFNELTKDLSKFFTTTKKD